MLASNYKDN
jgi:hypothetical protein